MPWGKCAGRHCGLYLDRPDRLPPIASAPLFPIGSLVEVPARAVYAVDAPAAFVAKPNNHGAGVSNFISTQLLIIKSVVSTLS